MGPVALILTFGQISGAHFDPAATIYELITGGISKRDVLAYIPARIVGAIAGVATAKTVFKLPVFFVSQKVRTG